MRYINLHFTYLLTYSSCETHLKAVECHLPYGITQRYLPPDTGEHATPQHEPDRPDLLELPTLEGWKAELTLVAGYIRRWFTCVHTVTHQSTNHVIACVTKQPDTDATAAVPNSVLM